MLVTKLIKHICLKHDSSAIFNLKSSICNCKKLFLLLTSYFVFFVSSAQFVSASLDRDKILLGEQVTLQFNLSNINQNAFFVTSWPHLKDTIAHIEILKRTSVDTINVNGYNSYQQSFTVTSFDSGRWQLGPFLFELQDKITNKKIQLKTDALYLSVLPVDVSSMQDYHPLKDIIEVEKKFSWLPVFIAIAVCLLAVIIFFILKKNKQKPAPLKPVLKGTALQRTLEKLYALEKMPLTSTTEIKKFHSEADIITRQYFEEVMHLKALQLTDTELLPRVNVYLQQAQLRSSLLDIFQINQSVKFAKYMPQAEESRNMLKEIIKSLNKIDEIINTSRNNAEQLVSKY